MALLATLALGLSPSSAAAQDPAEIVAAAIPHDSAISEQYQRVQEVLDQAAAAIPDAPLAQPAAESEPVAPPPPPAPEKPSPKPQYHSDTPSNVSVTQQQPSNVNVSIRINSPGNDGPVVQINNAGGTAVVEQVEQIVQRPEPAPAPAAPAGGDLPDTWEWVWTSACFGGAPRAGAATAVPGWSWRWSCDGAEQAGGGHDAVPAFPAMPDPEVPDARHLVAALAPAFAVVPQTVARERADKHAQSRAPAVKLDAAGPPPAARGGPPAARPPLAGVSAHAPPAAAAVRPQETRRAEARAGPGPGDGAASNLPPGGGPALGAASALGTVASLLLGIWTAVLATACVLAIPRLRHRWWSGLTGRSTRLPSLRLERPG